MKRDVLSFLLLAAAVFFIMLDLIFKLFYASGALFAVELILLFVLGAMSLPSLMKFNGRKDIFMAFFLLSLLNALFLFAMKGWIASVQALFAMAGIIVLMRGKEGYFEMKSNIQPYYTEPYYDGPRSVKSADKINLFSTEDVKPVYSPGKYVASKTGKKYHIATCDWAKKIGKRNQVWLNDRDEARKKGYKADSCVKQ